MGNGNDCCCSKVVTNTKVVHPAKEPNSKMEAYKSWFSLSKFIKSKKVLSTDVFLVSLKSIKNFINCIKVPKISNDLKSPEKEFLQKIEDILNNYYEEDKIEIYNDYEKCKEIAKSNNKEEKAFIIVDECFISNMGGNDYENKEVILDIDQRESNKMKMKMKIVFEGNKYLYFKENAEFYEFIYDNEYEQDDDKKEDDCKGKEDEVKMGQFKIVLIKKK